MKIFLTLFLCVCLCGCGPAAATVPPTRTPPVPVPEDFQFPEVDPVISLVVDPAVTGPAEGAMIEGTGVDPQKPVTALFPAHVAVSFPVYVRLIELDEQSAGARPEIRVYQSRDFTGYDEQGFPAQLEALKTVLASPLDPARCARPTDGDYHYAPLPYLPLVSAVQVFCARPLVVAFEGGRGVRYLTYYSQGIGPVLEGSVFYTFQGVSDGGEYYISASFPVKTHLLPEDSTAAGNANDLKIRKTLLREQVRELNNQPDGAYGPDLGALDRMIATIRVGGR